MPDLPHDLAFLTSVYTDQIYYKADTKDESGKRFKCTMPVLCEYNAKDCMVTYEIAQYEMHELEQLGMHDFYCGYVMPLYRALGEVTTVGVKIDPVEQDKFRWWYTMQAEAIQAELNEELGYELNVRSNPQMMKLLYEDLGLKPKLNRKTKRPSADKNALALLAEETDNLLLNRIVKLRSLQTLLSTFVEARLDDDGRIRTSYGVTETGRLTSTETIRHTGANLQNIPKEYRATFIADEGHKLISADKSQAEARAVAWLSNCTAMKDVFKSGEDLFRWVGSIVFDKRPDDITYNERQDSKRVVHGSDYRMGVKLFSVHIKKPLNEAKVIQGRYFSRFGEIRAWQNWIEKQVATVGRIETPFGRLRIFTGRYDENTYKEAIAFQPQSTVADDVNMGLLQLHYTLPEGARLILQVHDEVVVLCPDALVDEVVQLIKHVYSRPMRIHNDELIIPIEVKVGLNWYEMKEV